MSLNAVFPYLPDNHDMPLSPRQTYRQSILEGNSSRDSRGVCKTQEGRDERVEKRSFEIDLRGVHLKLDYYNGKQVLLYIQYAACH